MDVGRLRTGRGHWAPAAACALTLALTVGASAALAANPPPPPPPTTGGGGGSSGGGGGGGGSSTTPPPSKPARDTTPPGRVRNLRTVTNVPHRITITWSNPAASDLAGVVVQRGWNFCPATPHQGVRIGRAAIRRRQVDTGAAPGTAYCYAVFAFDHSSNYSRTVARRVIERVPPPPLQPVSDVQAIATKDGHIELTWRNPAPAALAGVSIVVVRGPASGCPTGPADGTPIGGTAVRQTQVDTTARPGSAYCYRVFVENASGNAKASNPKTHTAPTAPASVHPAGAAPAASSSGSRLTSMIVRIVAAIGAAMLLLTAAATLVARRRTHVSAYVAPRAYVPRMALTGVTPATLVIPAVLVVGSAAAIVLVLLNH